MTEEEKRLQEAGVHATDWKQWGPYLSDRAWGTVREDYSADGSAWEYFPHDHARSRAYRWNEDGLLGLCERRQYLCFSLALWNGHDAILKERLFGLTGSQGNHGEDVKEYYFYLDSTPTHSYMKALYKYPHAAFPYEELVEENARRGKNEGEYELIDTDIFKENCYFDVSMEYAKVDAEDILILITVVNHGPEPAALDVLPTLWFRNTWSWGEHTARPQLSLLPASSHMQADGTTVIRADHPNLDPYFLACQTDVVAPEMLFTENETNCVLVFGPNATNSTTFVKDGINDYVVQGKQEAVNPAHFGTKASARYHLNVAPGETQTIRLRLMNDNYVVTPLTGDFDSIFTIRKQEADAFYATIAPPDISDDAKQVQRQALAGLLWSKQYYNYDVRTWLEGDPGFPAPPPQRKQGRNSEWQHLNNYDVFSMPDAWEYPWYAAWDLAFHCITLSIIDPAFAKRQLILLCREWYMHPNGQLPAYEWAFSDVNPPVHAWAALRVFRIDRRVTGKSDYAFLEKIFHKLLINFTWWINRKDPDGRNVFEGGFLGLDNIGVFDRSAPLPSGERLEQSDGTAWMGMFCLNMLAMSIELARNDPAYEDVATKFFEHFMYIAGALNNLAGEGVALWDEADQFFYDVLRLPDKQALSLKVRSFVGLIPLFAVETIEQSDLDRFPAFADRMAWFLKNRPDLSDLVSHVQQPGQADRRLLSLVRAHRMQALLKRALDPDEFLSEHGLRSLSKFHKDHPYVLSIGGQSRIADYEPGESTSSLFGGNSNWRGPIWFPMNYLFIEALQKFHFYYGDGFLIECPTGSGQKLTLWQVAAEISRRLTHLFLKGPDGTRPVFGPNPIFQTDPAWKDYILFYEYFHGDTGMGLGASHQTGWTALVAKLIQQSGE